MLQAALIKEEQVNEKHVPKLHTEAEIEKHLLKEENNACIIYGEKETSYETPQYIIRGAAGDFFYGDIPAEDPNDAEGPFTPAQCIEHIKFYK